MRIISQDGALDVPYEMIAIQRFGENIYCLNKNLAGVEEVVDDFKLAEYSTEAKARKVMEMLQVNYLSRMELDGGYDDAHGCYVQPNYWVLPRAFQFPKDSEVEVAE